MPKRIEPTDNTMVVDKSKQQSTTASTKVEEGKASVSYTLSITKNIGNYESLKIQAGITIPHEASEEVLKDLDKLMVVAKEKVVNRIIVDVDDLTNSLT